MTGVIFDRRIVAGMKGRVYKTLVRAGMLYGLETGNDKKNRRVGWR